MLIKPVDQEHNLFEISDVFPTSITELIANELWLDLPWCRQEGQEAWRRRRILPSSISWIDQWHEHLCEVWPRIELQLGRPIAPYADTAFWVDEPGFTCSLHTDGEMPGSMQLVWRGSGTSFYWYKNFHSLRYQTPNNVNGGYIMINKANEQQYRKLLWHAMPEPVPANDFRLTSYTWITAI
jgi:hypothetical protein